MANKVGGKYVRPVLEELWELMKNENFDDLDDQAQSGTQKNCFKVLSNSAQDHVKMQVIHPEFHIAERDSQQPPIKIDKLFPTISRSPTFVASSWGVLLAVSPPVKGLRKPNRSIS